MKNEEIIDKLNALHEQSFQLCHFLDELQQIKAEYVRQDLQDAAKSINSKLEPWKVQLFIAYALNTKTRAFKCKWMPVKSK